MRPPLTASFIINAGGDTVQTYFPILVMRSRAKVYFESDNPSFCRYEINQMSLQAGEEDRLDFVLCARCLRTEASFDVVSEAPAVSIVPNGELVAGLEQEVRLALTTGSRHIQEVSESASVK